MPSINNETLAQKYIICSVCTYPDLANQEFGDATECERCGHRHTKLKPKSAKLTLAFSLTALILYLPANLFPFMTIELYGSRNSSTIWGGIVSLYESGSIAIALIVFFASILIPIAKLIILFYLATATQFGNPKFNTNLYFIIESIGRWSMLDIFLMAVLVGSVTKLILTKDSQTVLAQINIENKYVKLIRTNTVFWRKVGVQAKLGLLNASLKISSMDSLMKGGIDFFTPDNVGPIAKAQTKLPLVAAPPKDWEKWNPKLEF